MTARQELPGIYFDVRHQPVADSLPRMDIAAFVGFAERGPLHLPVAIEDVEQFRDIFGPPLRLGWDSERRRWQFSHLSACVEAFFLNGGVRCWVVRVADEASISHVQDIALPGLQDSGGSPAVCQARSPGTWAGRLTVATLLRRRRLEANAAPRMDGLLLDVRVARPAAELVRGDLLELIYGAIEVVVFVAVERIDQTDDGLTRAIGRAFTYSGAGSEESLVPVAFGAVQALVTAATPDALHRLSFDLLSYRGQLLEQRVEALGFVETHPRFWGHLPSDAELFSLREGDRSLAFDTARESLWQDVRAPRFPLAAPANPMTVYLPVNMSDQLLPQVPEIALEQLEANRLPEEGLGGLSADLFLDPELAGLLTANLVDTFKDKAYRRGEPVRGIHSLMRIDEVVAIAVPDAVHSGWRRGQPEFRQLPPPVLDAEFMPAEAAIGLTWSAVPAAETYRLQVATRADFSDPLHINARTLDPGGGLSTGAFYPVADLCRQDYFFRVRAETDDLISAWSNERVVDVPVPDFSVCDLVDAALDLTLQQGVGTTLEWSFAGAPVFASPAPLFELQSAAEPQFVAPQSEQLTGFTFEVAAGAVMRYFRVRALVEHSAGPWSNAVVVAPTELGSWLALPEQEYLAQPLLAVHRSLVRLCAARADAVALLSLPRHMRRAEIETYMSQLLPAGTLGSRPVAPLSEGERAALTYAGLFHGWVRTRAADGAGDLTVDSHPPDGFVAGVFAERTLDRGAWLAPANDPLKGALGIEPPFLTEDRLALSQLQVNLLGSDPGGFLWQTTHTLCRTREICLINVRRLLILLRRLALREGRRFAFEPNSADFRSQVRGQFERLLSQMYTRGAFRGSTADEAFQVRVDGGLNTPESIARGRLLIELAVAPSVPLEFLRVRLVQSAPEQLTVEEVR
ncbi:MAG: hypothetical protein U9P00_14005 [Pseudomonadota bacterium]|nr:hypothetical protein [Pseudomonadota bacterium]